MVFCDLVFFSSGFLDEPSTTDTCPNFQLRPMINKIQRICDRYFGILDSKIVLDAFASPCQNVMRLPYLSRIMNDEDPLCLQADFFEFNFDAYRRGGVIYT